MANFKHRVPRNATQATINKLIRVYPELKGRVWLLDITPEDEKDNTYTVTFFVDKDQLFIYKTIGKHQSISMASEISALNQHCQLVDIEVPNFTVRSGEILDMCVKLKFVF